MREREREREFHTASFSPSVDSSYLAPHMSNLMPGFEPAIDIDQQTDSNHDTALTLAAAGTYMYNHSDYYFNDCCELCVKQSICM